MVNILDVLKAITRPRDMRCQGMVLLCDDHVKRHKSRQMSGGEFPQAPTLDSTTAKKCSGPSKFDADETGDAIR